MDTKNWSFSVLPATANMFIKGKKGNGKGKVKVLSSSILSELKAPKWSV